MCEVENYSPFILNARYHLRDIESIDEKVSQEEIRIKSHSKSNKSSEDESHSQEKASLRTSHDIFYHLLWNPLANINTSDIYIGYLDRYIGMVELPLSVYDPQDFDNDIPFHRIHYFRTGPPSSSIEGKNNKDIFIGRRVWFNNKQGWTEGNLSLPEGSVLLWDREKRIDLIFGSGNTKKLMAEEKSKETEYASNQEKMKVAAAEGTFAIKPKKSKFTKKQQNKSHKHSNRSISKDQIEEEYGRIGRERGWE